MEFKIWIRLFIVLIASFSMMSCLVEPTTVTDEDGFIYQEYYGSEDYIVYLDNVAGEDSIVVPSIYNGHWIVAVGMYGWDKSVRLATAIELPDTISHILADAFSGFANLETLIIPDHVTTIGDSAFRGCTSLTSIWIPEGIVSLPNYLFKDCTSLAEVSFPSTLNAISASAFQGTYELDTVEFRNSENFRFVDGLITDFHKNVLVVYMPFNQDVSYTVPDYITHIGEFAFAENTVLEEVIIPDTVMTLGSNAFTRCTSLLSVDIGGGIEKLENNLFYDTENLETVTLHEGLLTISMHAFYMTNGLQYINIPASVTSIESMAFHYCVDLVAINVDSKNLNYTSVDGVLYTKNMEELITYPCQKTGTSFTIPNGVIIIKESAFEANYELRYLVISPTVETIEQSAFQYMDLSTVFIPDSVTTIGRNAFYGHTGLTIRCEVSSKPDGWNTAWYMTGQTLVWGYTQSK
ncbi:MAG: leucine-rich repeat domain-containing protein [Bacilli bacterium]|nr:leucine-rich repeat domain-containing protein [Bacilli bacterium]MBN2877876.1 leucine-rich repeat domain-containing protein [Bacilli bacterium]